MLWSFTGYFLELPIKMGDVVVTYYFCDFQNSLIIGNEEPTCLTYSDFIKEPAERFTRSGFKISAKR